MPTSKLTQAWRIARLMLHLIRGLCEVGLIFPLRTAAGREAAVVRWSVRLCRILQIELRSLGQCPPQRPKRTLLIANHISWLDIFILNASFASNFVAKAEVREWPLIGWLCQQTGTLFITRERRHDTRRVNRQIESALESGACVAVFPEGGTSDGRTVSPFNASLLQPAIDAHAHIQPAGLRYLDLNQQTTLAASYVGEMSLLESVRTLVSQPGLIAEVHYFPAISAAHRSRRDIAQEAEATIRHFVCGATSAKQADAKPPVPPPETQPDLQAARQ